MDENIESVTTSEVAEPIVTETIESTNNVSEDTVNPQVDEKQAQSAEENSKYADMRRKLQAEGQAETQKQIDAEYSKLYGKDYGIHTKADFDKAIAKQNREAEIQQEAQKQGISEELARRLKDLEDSNKATTTEKANYERQLNLIKEDESLKKDETFSDYYAEYEAEIKKSANDFGVDLTTAMLLSIKDNFKAIKEGVTKKVQQETVNNMIKNKSTSTGSLADAVKPQSNSIADMSDVDFKKMQERALRGELRKK